MTEAGAAKPVAIRLAQRYPNGSMISYSGRAIAHDEVSVCVLINEEFETGIKLSLMAPFLEGITSTRVFSVTRSRKQPGLFEVFLQIGEGAEAAVRLKANSQNHLRESTESGAGKAENSQGENANPSKTASAVPEMAAEAADRLAGELVKEPARSLVDVLNDTPSALRSMSLLVAVAAAIHLLQEKGHVEAHRLLDGTTGGAAERASKTGKPREVART